MADPRPLDLEDAVTRPGTYLNPQTEVLIVVDDSPDLDAEIFDMEEFEGVEWVMISDEVPIDDDARDELLQAFQVRHGAARGAVLGDDDIVDEDENAEPEADELDDE